MRFAPYVIGLVVAFASYQIGLSRGQKDCPEMARAWQEVEDAERASFEAFLAEMPSGREAVCDKVFHLIEGSLAQERYDFENDMDSHARGPGE